MSYIPGVRTNKTAAIAAADANKVTDINSLITMFNSNLTDSFAVSIFDNTNLSAEKAAMVIGSATITVAKAASWFGNSGLSTTRCAAILNSTNVDVSKSISILSDASITADKAQSIMYDSNLSTSKLIDIITNTAGDAIISANTTISNVSRYKNLTINSNRWLYVGGQPGVIICNTLTNNGIIDKTATGGAGGANGAGYGGAGGNGGGGLLILCKNFDNNYYVQAKGVAGSMGGMANNGIPSQGSPGSTKTIYRYSTSSYSGSGGTGGGGNFCPPGGAGGTPTYMTTTAFNIFNLVRKAGIDWYLVNVISKSPTSTTAFLDVGGPGGGGASYNGGTCGGGASSGAGGEAIIACDIFDNSGTITTYTVSGLTASPSGCCGNGGSGQHGIIYGLADTTNVSSGSLQSYGYSLITVV